MKKNNSFKVLLGWLVLFSMFAPVLAQRGRKPIIFAVLGGGSTLEPIAYIEKGELTATVGGGDEMKDIVAFNKSFYKPGGTYRLIFGGTNAGTVTIKNSDANAECSKNTAFITAQTTKTKLGGNVMALATDAVAKKAASGLRRKPTPAERSEIEALVRAELAKQKVSAAAIKNMKYQNLTALDVDNDKKPDFVGSFWAETAKSQRGLLFFIAEKNEAGKYKFSFTEYRTIKPEDIMSGADIKSVDEGVYQELLLDVFDYDGDGVSEIFTYIQGLEGAGFNAYKRENGSWKRVFEGSNYHCAF